MKSALQTGAGQIDQNDAGKSHQTAGKLGGSQGFHAEYQTDGQDGNEDIGAFDDGTLDAAGVCHADIEEKVLGNGLEKAKSYHIAPPGMLRCGIAAHGRCKTETAAADSGKGEHQNSCQKEADPGKQKLAAGIGGIHVEHLISDLDTGKSTSPQKTTDTGTETDDPALLPECSA